MPSIHVPVDELNVPRAWRVGRVTFRPEGWLLRRVERAIARGATYRPLSPVFVEPLADRAGATAEVRIRTSKSTDAYGQAIDYTRDAVALLLLYKRVRYPRLPWGVQHFGVPGDVGVSRVVSVVTKGPSVVGSYMRHSGQIGSWDFSREDVAAFGADLRIAYLDATLRVLPGERTEVQRRLVQALRARALAATILQDQMRVILLGAGLDFLLSTEGAEQRGEFLRITNRAAYLICGRPDAPYPSRPACALLSVTSEKALQNVKAAHRARGLPDECTWYEHVRGILKDRNQAVHSGQQDFDRGRIGWHFITFDDVLLRLVDWTLAGGTTISELDVELDAFVGRTGTQPSAPVPSPPAMTSPP